MSTAIWQTNMSDHNHKKTKQIGMNFGTASNRLRKMKHFECLVKLGENICFQCGEKIENCSELSIEHKVPYLDSTDPQALFWSLDNVAYSHLNCNSGAARHKRNEE